MKPHFVILLVLLHVTAWSAPVNVQEVRERVVQQVNEQPVRAVDLQQFKRIVVPQPKVEETTIDKAAAQLRWQNSEVLGGEIFEATPEVLAWKSPYFNEPLYVSWSALRRIDQQQRSEPTADPFSFTCKDGSFFFGDLVAVTDSTVSIRSSRHGESQLRRAELLNIRRLKSAEKNQQEPSTNGGKDARIVFCGPQGDVGWAESNKGQRSESDQPGVKLRKSFFGGPGGALLIPYWNRSVSLDLQFPELVDLEFRISSSKRPDFKFSIADSSLSIETWDEDLVLSVGTKFKLLQKLAATDRAVDVRLCWDRKSNKCTVYNSAGDLLAEWLVPEQTPGKTTGSIIVNKGRDLTVNLLKLREWNHQAPSKKDPTKPHVELAGGRVLSGDIISCADGVLKTRSGAEQTEESLSLNDVDTIVFATTPIATQPSFVTLAYSDGSYLMGRINSIKEGSALLSVGFSEKPLGCSTAGLRQCLINAPKPNTNAVDAALDKLTIHDTILHGKLTCIGGGQFGWLPVGGSRPSSPVSGLQLKVARAFPADVEFPRPPSLIYTTGGDVLPAVINAVNAAGVEFSSPLFEVLKMPSTQIDGIQFAPLARPSIRGFDEKWQVLKGTDKTVRKTKEKLKMEGSVSVGHPSAMLCRELSFQMESAQYGAMRMRLFNENLNEPKASGTSVLLLYSGGDITVGLEHQEGQMMSQSQAKIVRDKPVTIKLITKEKAVEIYANDALVQTLVIDAKKRTGNGLIIEPAGLWGNQAGNLVLLDFAGRSEVGTMALPTIDAETKRQALTVPRFRKESPPAHALVASNGDLLRGTIESTTNNHLGFRAGLESLRIPKERVQLAVWLKNANGQPAEPTVADLTLKKLEKPLDHRGRIGANLEYFIDFIRQRDSSIKIMMPKQNRPQSLSLRIDGDTIGSLLDKICASCNLQYRVGDSGEIVLESTANISGGKFARKMYWLKTVAFPDLSTFKSALIKKGIVFPSGTDAHWDAESKVFQMTNTIASHEAFKALADSDFGGLAGAPSHWLLLTNGARFGLTVEDFGATAVTGSHPTYGRCTIPLADIYSIRNTMPDYTNSLKPLKDWRLVPAQEPVLPDSGDEDSALVGTLAKSCKLQVVGGGEFDLAKETGKVVVLDFWATWCGPCVKSLPGLIEAVAAFPADKVQLIGINQGESADTVKKFLDARRWSLKVALDGGQSVAKQYGVSGIPHTVIVAPDGKVALVKTGYSPDGAKEIAEAIKKMLNPQKPVPAP